MGGDLMIFSVSQESYTMQAKLEIIGKDLLIVITGGDSPHVGSVTTLTSNTELQTIRFPSHDGRFHKDNVLGERVAKIIQSSLSGSCTITSGVHVNGITKKQIMSASSMADNLGQQILQWIKFNPQQIDEPIYYSDSEHPK